MAKEQTLEYKVYYHSLVPGIDGLQCFGSNLPDHPKGSCLNPKHPLVHPNLKRSRERTGLWYFDGQVFYQGRNT